MKIAQLEKQLEKVTPTRDGRTAESAEESATL